MRGLSRSFSHTSSSEIRVGRQQPLRLDRERLGEHLRVVDGHLEVHVAEVATAQALGEAQRLGLRVAAAVEPRTVVESRRDDDQRVPFPPADRVPEPGRIGVDGQSRPSVNTVRCGLLGDSYSISISAGVCTTRVRLKKLWNGALTGRHRASGLSLRASRRAAGRAPPPRVERPLAQILRDVETVRGPAPRQTPDRSGLPSAVRGVGADRFGRPSARRGVPGVG